MKHRNQPPVWIDRFLQWRLPEEQFEEVQGDMHELYALWVSKMRKRKANWLYLLNALTFLRPLPKPKVKYPRANPFYMTRNYLTIAFRNVIRHKVFSVINVFGLALGMSCSLLIFLWVQDELSYDRFHTNGNQLYQVMATLYWGEVSTSNNTPDPLANVLKDEIPGISKVAKTSFQAHVLFALGEKKQKQKGYFVSPEFLEMFTFPLIEGNTSTALSSPDAVVISQQVAQKFFGQENAVGKTIRINNEREAKITGVVQNLPDQSTLQFDWLMPYETYAKGKDWLKMWGMLGIFTYVQLQPEVSRAAVESKIKNLLPKHNPESLKDELFLHAFPDTYLHSSFKNGKPDGGRIEYVQLFSVVALLVLLIACINFMNLSTARAANRAKEIGIRKVIGAARYMLIKQFVSEALLLAIVALLLSLVMVSLFLPTFNALTDKAIDIPFSDTAFIIVLLLLTLSTGLLAGSYPALVLSAMHPVKALKGSIKLGIEGLIVRKGLVVFQFVISTVLIIATIVIFQQIYYIQDKNLGFDRQNVITLPKEGALYQHGEAFKENLLQSSAIQSVSAIGANPLEMNNTSTDVNWPGKPANFTVTVSPAWVDYDYLSTMNIGLIRGRDFSKNYPTDSTAYIINASAARLLGMENPVGQEIEFWKGKGKIIGVTEDFHIQSLHEPIKPVILMLSSRNTWLLLVKAQTEHTAQALEHLEKVVQKFNPGFTFEYHFLDETFEKQYSSELIVGKLAFYFTFLTILIACLGLFGLVTFTAGQRSKEIGIRRVLGASVINITILLSKDFFKLVILSITIACPLAWWIMHIWLQSFAYKLSLNPMIFVLTALTALFIAMLTLSYQAIKSALANPVKSLRNE